jgi:shikimate kinase
MKDKKNIVLIGMPGSGKTTVGEMLAQKLGYKFYDADDVIVKSFGDIHSLFERGEDYFRQCETESLKGLAKKSGAVIATGGGCVTRIENIEALKNSGVIVFLDRSVENIIKDVVTETRPLLADGKDKLFDLYEERIGLYNKYADIIIDSNKELDLVIDDILEKVKES